MSNKPIIYLHIGLPKTGTSSIQNYFKINYDKLIEKKSCLYPVTGRNDFHNHNHMRFSFGGRNLWFKALQQIGVLKKDLKYPPTPQLNEQLLEEVKAAKADKIVISSEWFSVFISQKAIREIKSTFGNDFTIKPVIYLRPQELTIRSLYNQLVKHPNSRLSLDFMPRIWVRIPFFDYNKLYDKWVSVFGQENVIVRRYEHLVNNDVIDDILDIINIDKDHLEVPHADVNVSLDDHTTSILLEANKRKLSEEEFAALRTELSSKEKSSADQKALEEREYIRKFFQKKNDALSLKLYGKKGMLDAKARK